MSHTKALQELLSDKLGNNDSVLNILIDAMDKYCEEHDLDSGTFAYDIQVNVTIDEDYISDDDLDELQLNNLIDGYVEEDNE